LDLRYGKSLLSYDLLFVWIFLYQNLKIPCLWYPVFYLH